MICPKCKAEIDHMDVVGSSYARAFLDDDGCSIFYDEISVDYFGCDYTCPECRDVIATGGEALTLLGGEE